MNQKNKDRIANWKLHDSQRGQFSLALYKAMARDEDIWCLTADLGFGVLDAHRDDFPDRFVNFGASEQCMIGVAVGLALSGKKPFCYSITSFLIYRPFEWIRNYLQYEGVPVCLVGSGMGKDYEHDGITHQPHELTKVLKLFPVITSYFPHSKADVIESVEAMVAVDEPSFLCLRR